MSSSDLTPFANAFMFSPKDQGGSDTLDSGTSTRPQQVLPTYFSLGASATVTVTWESFLSAFVSPRGPTPLAIQAIVDSFRNRPGHTESEPGGLSQLAAAVRSTLGRRSGTVCSAEQPACRLLQPNSPRGVVYSTAGTGFQVSGATGDSGAGQLAAARFGNIQASYTANFQTFSAQRLFTALGNNVSDVNFFVPGRTHRILDGFRRSSSATWRPPAAPRSSSSTRTAHR